MFSTGPHRRTFHFKNSSVTSRAVPVVPRESSVQRWTQVDSGGG